MFCFVISLMTQFTLLKDFFFNKWDLSTSLSKAQNFFLFFLFAYSLNKSQRQSRANKKKVDGRENKREGAVPFSLTLQEVFQLTKNTLTNRNISRKYPGAYQTGKALQFHLSQRNCSLYHIWTKLTTCIQVRLCRSTSASLVKELEKKIYKTCDTP